MLFQVIAEASITSVSKILGTNMQSKELRNVHFECASVGPPFQDTFKVRSTKDMMKFFCKVHLRDLCRIPVTCGRHDLGKVPISLSLKFGRIRGDILRSRNRQRTGRRRRRRCSRIVQLLEDFLLLFQLRELLVKGFHDVDDRVDEESIRSCVIRCSAERESAFVATSPFSVARADDTD